jgi:hypothetical protein
MTHQICNGLSASVNCAPEMTPRQEREAAERDAALITLRAELVAVQQKVLAVHGSVANLIDAVVGMETAIADVDFERERAA